MIDDPDELAQALASAGLPGQRVGRVAVPESDTEVLWIQYPAATARAAWSLARYAVPDTGRWPLVTGAFSGDPATLFSREPFRSAGPSDDVSVEAILQRAAAVHPASAVADLEAEIAPWNQVEGDRLAFELAWTASVVGHSPPPEQLTAALGSRVSETDLQRWLLGWERAKGVPDTDDGSHLAFIDFFADDETFVVFLPTDQGWQAPAYLHYFYAGGKPGWIERVIAVLRSWDERFGAELMAHLGSTVLDFVVERPPLTLDDAWPLAREHQLIGPSTLARPLVPLRIHARALVGRPTWSVWEQP